VSPRVGISRTDVVGSLLRPAYLRDARQRRREGKIDDGKLRAVEDRAVRDAIELQLRPAAAGYVPLTRLAVSPQCGFASGEAGNPLTPEEQEAKLRRVVEVARRIW
jgi:methionine synthase II (cobalamin-independent)